MPEPVSVVVGVLGTVMKGMVGNIKKVSERATVTESQNICMLESARILRKVFSVWTWLTDAPGAWLVHAQKEHQQRLWQKRP